MDNPISEYVNSLGKDGVYADNVAVQCLGDVLEMKINVIQLDGNDLQLGNVDSSDVLCIGYMPNIKHYVSVVQQSPLLSEHYYCVFYTHPASYFMGRIASLDCHCEAHPSKHVKMLFLKKDYLTKMFAWPKSSKQYECVLPQFIFFGPVTLIGAGPFSVPEQELFQIKKTI